MLEAILAFTILYIKYRRRLWEFSYTTLDQALVHREQKHGQRKWSFMLVGLLLLTACLYVRPSSHCAFMGKYYAQLASAPFGFEAANPVPHRILTSLISYLIGLRGHLIIITNLLIASTLVYLVYRYFRKNTSQPADSLLAAATITFSLPTLLTIYYGGYNDALSFLLIFLMWLFRSRRFVFYPLFFLGLMNRETVAFLIPWFVYISFEFEEKKIIRSIELLVGFSIALGLYFLFRYWISQQQELEFSTTYYLRPLVNDPLFWFRMSFSHIPLGFFSVFKVLWIFPGAAALSAWKRGERRLLMSSLLLIAGGASQLFFAYDVSRLLTLSFMIMIISLAYLFQTNAFEFRKWAGWAFIFNLMVPNFTVAGKKLDVMHSLLSYMIDSVLRK